MSARLIPPPQLHLHRITRCSQKNTDTTLLRAPSELSENRTEASVRTVLGRALVRRRKQRCASYTNTAVPTGIQQSSSGATAVLNSHTQDRAVAYSHLTETGGTMLRCCNPDSAGIAQ